MTQKLYLISFSVMVKYAHIHVLAAENERCASRLGLTAEVILGSQTCLFQQSHTSDVRNIKKLCSEPMFFLFVVSLTEHSVTFMSSSSLSALFRLINMHLLKLSKR